MVISLLPFVEIKKRTQAKQLEITDMHIFSIVLHQKVVYFEIQELSGDLPEHLQSRCLRSTQPRHTIMGPPAVDDTRAECTHHGGVERHDDVLVPDGRAVRNRRPFTSRRAVAELEPPAEHALSLLQVLHQHDRAWCALRLGRKREGRGVPAECRRGAEARRRAERVVDLLEMVDINDQQR